MKQKLDRLDKALEKTEKAKAAKEEEDGSEITSVEDSKKDKDKEV